MINKKHLFVGVVCTTLVGCNAKTMQLVNSAAEVASTLTASQQATQEAAVFAAVEPSQAISNGPELKKFQALLNAKGYKVGTVDGFYGKKTGLAIAQYQKANNLPVTGTPTTTLLKQLSDTSVVQTASAAESGYKTFAMGDCVESKYDGLNTMASSLFSRATEQFDTDIGNYLTGLCIPEDRAKLIDLYIYLVSEGVSHGHLVMSQYNELDRLYTKAGVDIGVTRDAINRSSEALPELDENNTDLLTGVTFLLDSTKTPDDNAAYLNGVVSGYKQLGRAYRQEADGILSSIMGHAKSSTFFLARSGYAMQQLTSFIDLDKNTGTSHILDQVTKVLEGETNLDDFGKSVDLIKFMSTRSDEIFDILTTSAYSIKALSSDIKTIPEIDDDKTDEEVHELMAETGIDLSDLEKEFSKDQKEQLSSL
ncbi:MAG: peptidoglycan-binding domain-containing protein [Methylococcales bacterium]